MQTKEHRLNFIIKFFENYDDYNIDLNMRLYPLFFSDNEYMIKWIDYSKHKVLILNEFALNKNSEIEINGLVTYFFKEIDYNNVIFHHIQLDFYNANKEIETFMELFNNYFSLNYNQDEFIKLIDTKTYKYRMDILHPLKS